MTHNNKVVGRSLDVEGIWRMRSTAAFVRNWPQISEQPNSFLVFRTESTQEDRYCFASCRVRMVSRICTKDLWRVVHKNDFLFSHESNSPMVGSLRERTRGWCRMHWYSRIFVRCILNPCSGKSLRS
jgi:hypothetical protein